MTSSNWNCSGCGADVDDERIQPRKPCPHCGSMARTANVSVHIAAEATIHLLTKSKHRDGGKRVVREIVAGDSYHRLTSRWNLLRRLIDWGNDWYEETVRQKDGSLIHYCAEKLSEHTGHGTAKKKPRAD